MPDLSSVQAVYFDLDDTLCTYWDASKAALRETFVRHPVGGLDASQMVRHWAAVFREFSPTLKHTDWYDGYLKKGEPTRTEQMRMTLLRVGVDDPSLARVLGDTYAQLRDSNLRLFEEAEEVLERLFGRYPLGLITNGPADIQRQEIGTLAVERFFQHIFIEGEMGLGKPLPEAFRRAERAVGLPPERIVFVGNSYAHDIRPAVEAGWKTVWIRRPSDVPPSTEDQDPKPEQRPEGAPAPDAEIGDLRALLPMLGVV